MSHLEEPTLSLLSEKTLPFNTIISCTTICDPTELIGIVPEASHDIHVFRFNGQTAYTIRRRSPDAEVTTLRFKPDGTILAVGYSDGICTLHSGENGKFIGQISVRRDLTEDDWNLDISPSWGVEDDEDDSGVAVASISWCLHESSEIRPTQAGEGLDTEQWADAVPRDQNSQWATTPGTAKQLTNELTRLDVTRILPKLNTIPAHGVRHGAESGLFTSQATLDSLFDLTSKKETSSNISSSASVDILTVSSALGNAVVLVDDTVKIGDTTFLGKLQRSSSHPQSSHHVSLGLLADDNPGQPPSHLLQYLDLPIEFLGGPLLSVISTNTKRMQNLLKYITHTVRCIEHDWTTGLALPNRVIKNITEELAEKQEGDLVTNLYHLAMTGCFTKTMEEWLTDIIKETNHKRWDTAVSNMYSHIQDHIFFNLLPALDRLSIATTTLRGHATFGRPDGTFDLDPQLFTNILEGVDSVRLVAQKAQLRIMTELRQFAAFSKWLRVMVDVGMGNGTTSAVETEEREAPNIDHGLVLAYIKHTLTGSKLEWHVGPIPGNPPCSRQEFFEHPLIKDKTYATTVDAAAALDKNELPESSRNLVNFSAITVFLNGHARVALDSITKWQSKMIPEGPRIKPGLSLADGTKSQAIVKDMKMLCKNPSNNAHPDHYTDVLSAEAQDEETQLVWLFRTITRRMPSSNGQPGPEFGFPQHYTSEGFDVAEIADLKILDNDTFLELSRTHDSTWRIVAHDTESFLKERHPPVTARTIHKWPTSSTFKPTRLLMGGRPGQKVCLVLGAGGRQWQILELDPVTAAA